MAHLAGGMHVVYSYELLYKLVSLAASKVGWKDFPKVGQEFLSGRTSNSRKVFPVGQN